MTKIKAVITDYIGTLTNARRYTMEASVEKLHDALSEAGFQTQKDEFQACYAKAHEKYRLIRYGEFREVTNAVWVSETLCNLGFNVTVEDCRLNGALNVFFQDFIESLELRPYAEQLLAEATKSCKMALVSNFTYGPVVHLSLKKLGISRYFDTIVVSHDAGWRKPHERIFKDALQKLGVSAEEAVFIGDCPLEDIKGARSAGMKTVFVVSQFYDLEDLKASGEKPDFVASDLKEICSNLYKMVS